MTVFLKLLALDKVKFVAEDGLQSKLGGYIQIEIPACEINYKDIDIT